MGLYGLEAINANNGWAISAVGISIVFTGLVVLSLVISQLHKVVDLYENPEKIKEWFAPKPAPEPEPEALAEAAADLSEAQRDDVRQFELLAKTLDAHFALPRLLHLAESRGINTPHSNLNLLLNIGIVVPDMEGYFCWDSERFDQTIAG